jgi:Uma2 family endonuclease
MAASSVPQAGQRIDPGAYRRLVDDGAFDEGARLELIDGVLLAMCPKTRQHEKAIRYLTRLLVRAVDPDRFDVGVSSPLTVGDSEPEPDLIVIEHGTPEPNHPATAALVIEVAHTSHERDLLTKPGIYAAAGVPVYWVVDLTNREVVVHRRPAPEGFQEVETVPADGRLDASHVGVDAIDVAALLAAAFA